MDISVVGLGLIGGSLLRRLAADGHRVLGFDADPATRATARTAAAQAPEGSRWQIVGTLRDAVRDARLVVLAVPLPALPSVLDDLAAAGHDGLVTDVTSVKGPVRDLVGRHLKRDSPGGGFVGGHPMAGRETSGFGASDADLFTGCAWVLCLEPGETSLDDWLELAALVTGLSARVVPATAAEHDRAVAAVSHVPHLLAAALAATVSTDPLAGTLAAGSFRDGTRVAASPPDLMAAMCGGNAAAVDAALAPVLTALARARDGVRSAAPVETLRDWFAPASAVRAAWPPRPGPSYPLAADPDALLELGRAGGWITAVAGDRRTVTAVRPTSAR